MKRETRIRAIARLVAMHSAESLATAAEDYAAKQTRSASNPALAAEAAAKAWAARQTATAAEGAWKALARPQRDYALKGHAAAMSLASAAVSMGGRYSGDTESATGWGETARATTSTTSGDRYSSRCTYRKVDGFHAVTITIDGMVDLLAAPELARVSAAEGLPLISYNASTGAAVWVAAKNKRLSAVHGWIAAGGGIVYHSTQSMEHARGGLARKARAAEREAARARLDARADRRARLVVRLCRGAVATVGDALAAGYCEPGIKAWQEKNGIGDSAPLAELVRTGDPLATQLAFNLARRLRRETAAVSG